MTGPIPGLGLKAPMHLNYNLTELRAILPGLSAFTGVFSTVSYAHISGLNLGLCLAVAAAIDGGCDIGGAAGGAALPGFNRVYNCHDIAEWQHARVKVYVLDAACFVYIHAGD